MKIRITLFFFAVISIIFLSFSSGSTELVGELSKEEILKNLPDWNVVIASYFPDPEIIKKLQSINRIVRIEVFLGTWCADCKEHVSSYFKILDLVDNPHFSSTYVGIPRDREARKLIIQGKNIERVPTFIVYIDDEEKGRIIEHPKKTIEEDLFNIITR